MITHLRELTVKKIIFDKMLLILLYCFGVLYALTTTGGPTSVLCAQEPSVRVFTERFDPAEHPDRARLHVPPPSWSAFDGKTQFIALRSFPARDGKGYDFEPVIDRYQKDNLGRILWPHCQTIFFENLGELADIVNKKNLFLFDFWGYVPGSGPRESGDWTQFHADPAQFRLLEEKLGERWLGMDNGEQDGRYIGGYAPQNIPVSNDRTKQYLFFQNHFERLGDELGNRLATLVSLNFGHYFLKEGVYTLIGAETAQALPNSQVYYSWIRGAGKQYGVLWFGNASVYNRWGWKSYPTGDGAHYGPTKGTSLSLLKRLMYSHILYNSAAVGFENGWFTGPDLGNIGRIQKSASKWLDENGDPGAMATSIGFLCDFNSGWSFPRHLYSRNTYRVWGTIPYQSGDYLTNNLFGLVYPRYQDSSYFHDETGFLTATPYGDSVDSLLTDAPSWLLARYPLLIAADELAPSAELCDKLTKYVQMGGRLVLTAGNLERFANGLCGVSASGKPQSFPKGAEIDFGEKSTVTEAQPFCLVRLNLPENAKILARCGGQVAAAEVPFGQGAIVVLASEFGIAQQRALDGPIANAVDQPLDNPFPMLTHVQQVIESELNRTVLFDVGQSLGAIVCRKAPRKYTIGVFNNELEAKPFKIHSRIGEIESIRELPTDVSERSAEGFLPEGFENAPLGTDSDDTIAGSSVRIFEVTLKEDRTIPIEKLAPPAAPKGTGLALRDITPVKESILARPTFFQHFDGIMIDWTYLNSRSMEQVQRESGWIRRQKLEITVDFSSGINLYPDLRLIKNDPEEYRRSMAAIEDTIRKAAVFGAKTIVLRTHRTPENNYSSDQTQTDMQAAMRDLCKTAAGYGMTLVLRVGKSSPNKTLQSGADFINRVGEPNLKLAPSLQSISRTDPETLKRLEDKIALIFLAGTLFDENNGEAWTEHAPVTALPPDGFAPLRNLKARPVIFDASYQNQDEEYRDVQKRIESSPW